MTRTSTIALLMCGLLAGMGQSEAGQEAAVDGSREAVPVGYDGPPPPVPPEVIARDAAGRVTVRAVRIETPLSIDGRLDEAVYGEVPAISGFIQNEPMEGAPASEKTEVWVFYDRDTFYVVARCWETHPERMVANEMRRDNINIVQNDQFAFTLDTFYDRRNSFLFEIGAAGGRIDGQVTNERQVTLDWNPVWETAVGRFEGGWTVEAAVPFKSLRYQPGPAQVWGIQMRRMSKWRNEYAFLTAVPASAGTAGHFRSSLFATLVGLEAPTGGVNLEIKPYAITDLTTDHTVSPRISNDVGGDVGLDVKYGITQGLTADVTVNTDFAQVEADEQQVNLTRFSLFFPEKREFFLENAGTYGFGGAASSGRFAGGSDTPILFYSRQIGLTGGREVPIRAGGRVTGRVGLFSVGVLNVQAGEDPVAGTRATNFSVIRVKRDLLRKSSIGILFTGRSVSQRGVGSNEAYGIDGNFSFFDDLAINTYWARTRTDGLTTDDDSYRAQLDYAGDRYGVQAEHLAVGAGFNPEVGFARRRDMRKNYGYFRFSPRTTSSARVRKYSWTGSFNHIENGAGQLETRIWNGEFEVQFNNSDRFFVAYDNNHEFLPQPFPIAQGVTLPVGGYDFAAGRVGYDFGRQRNLSGNLSAEYGSFFNGNKTTVTASQGRVNFGPQISVEPSVSINWVDLEQGSFTTRLVTTRVTYTVTPLMFVNALLQYNSGTDSVAVNVRLRWEYQPGSELFIVYNEQRDTLSRSFPDIENRAFIVKINRLFRF